MIYFTKIIIILLCFLGQSWAAKQIYQMKDLRVLAGERNHQEFFEHALDVKPANRTKEWKEMVESMGQSYMEQLIARSHVDKASYQAVKKLSNWPIFKENEFFIKKRDLVFLREIVTCELKPLTNCIDLAKKIYDDYKHELTFDYDFITAIEKLGASQQMLWSYARKLVANSISEFYCNKPNLSQIIRNQAVWEFETQSNVDLDIHPDCLKSLANDLKKDLTAAKPSIKNSAFKLLSKAGLLKREDKEIFYLLHFIDSKELSSQLLENSLANLKKLAKEYKQREFLVSQYKKLDPLPDNIFGDEKNSSISRIKILARYFPEIIDSYALTCLDYLDGLRTFPNGNPTPNCHHFFELAKKHRFVPDSFTKRYDKATYFMQKSI